MNIEVMRAQEEWQRAGAYTVRVQGMNRQCGISLREEFDEHDCDGTKYIVLLDGGYPVATCRFYEVGENAVTLGRVVVLPEYRGMGLGKMAVRQAEEWIALLGYKKIVIDSRVEAVGFYEKLGYSATGGSAKQNGVFKCVEMRKRLG